MICLMVETRKENMVSTTHAGEAGKSTWSSARIPPQGSCLPLSLFCIQESAIFCMMITHAPISSLHSPSNRKSSNYHKFYKSHVGYTSQKVTRSEQHDCSGHQCLDYLMLQEWHSQEAFIRSSFLPFICQ